MAHTPEHAAESLPHLVGRSSSGVPAPALAGNAIAHGITFDIRLIGDQGKLLLLSCWIGGTALCALIALKRILRFERFLRGTMPASERLQQETIGVAAKLRIRRVPRVCLAEGVQVPLLWWAGRRATIVLPKCLFSRLDDHGKALILAHEL